MKKSIIFIFFVVTQMNLFAQISIQPVLPLAGIVQKSNLWNIALINTSNANYDCRIELILRDRTSGLEVITATSSQFQITQGAKQLNSSLLAPIQYNYISSDANRRDDFIPIGNYIVCYRLTVIGKTPIAEECIAFDVEPLSPPMLITPSDSALLESSPSQFSWIPPAPLNLFNRLDYEVVIAEIHEGQKPEEAIQQNLPFYNESNIIINNLAYKGTVNNFEKDKWYAWQVLAKDERNYAGKSEVWVFKISNEKVTTLPNYPFYLLMEENITGSYIINSKTLFLKYPSQTTIFDAEVVFMNEKGNIIKKENKKIIQGDNYLSFDLNNQFKENKIYTVSVNGRNNKARTITFSINTKK